MKKLFGAVLFLIVVAAVAQFINKGELPFLAEKSGAQKRIGELRSELRSAQREFRQAGRSAGLAGMDTTGDASAALATVDRIEKELKKLSSELPDGTDKDAAVLLQQEIDNFKREVDR